MPNSSHPIRTLRPIPGGGHRVGGYFNSTKAGRPLAWVTTLQLDYLRVTEVDPEIRAIEDQPLAVTCWFNKRKRRWAPPFRIQHGTEASLVAVFSAYELETATNSGWVDHIRKASAATDHGFVVADEKSIRSEPRLTNAKQLLVSRTHEPAPFVREALINSVRTSPRRLGDLIQDSHSRTARHDVLALCRTGTLYIDLDQPLTGDAIVTLGRGVS